MREEKKNKICTIFKNKTVKQFFNNKMSFLSPSWRPSGKGLFSARSSIPQKKKLYSKEEVSLHIKEDDCWIIIDNKVYDITKYISLHPGGDYILKKNAGKDATIGFNKARHSRRASELLAKYYIGDLDV